MYIYIYMYLLRLIIKDCQYMVHRCGRGVGRQVRIEPYYSLPPDLIRVPIIYIYKYGRPPPNPRCTLHSHIHISRYRYTHSSFPSLHALPAFVASLYILPTNNIDTHILIYTLPAEPTVRGGCTPHGRGRG
jgi:hypothetical protein